MEEILLIIVTLLIAEIIIWELPQFLAKRVKLAAGLSICLVTSAFAAGAAFVLIMMSPKSTEVLMPGIVSFALLVIFALGSCTVFWYEQRKSSSL